MDADHVGALGHVSWRRRELDPDQARRRLDPHLLRLPVRQRPFLSRVPPAPQHDVHAEPRGAADHLAANAADTQQAERLAVEPLRL